MWRVKMWIAEHIPYAWKIVPMSWFGQDEDCCCFDMEEGD